RPWPGPSPVQLSRPLVIGATAVPRVLPGSGDGADDADILVDPLDQLDGTGHVHAVAVGQVQNGGLLAKVVVQPQNLAADPRELGHVFSLTEMERRQGKVYQASILNARTGSGFRPNTKTCTPVWAVESGGHLKRFRSRINDVFKEEFLYL